MFLCVKNKKIVIGMLVWASYFVATGCVVSAQKMDTHVDEKVKAKLPLWEKNRIVIERNCVRPISRLSQPSFWTSA